MPKSENEIGSVREREIWKEIEEQTSITGA